MAERLQRRLGPRLDSAPGSLEGIRDPRLLPRALRSARPAPLWDPGTHHPLVQSARTAADDADRERTLRGADPRSPRARVRRRRSGELDRARRADRLRRARVLHLRARECFSVGRYFSTTSRTPLTLRSLVTS